MSKVFSNLQTDARSYLDEASQSDWLDTEVKSALNYAYHDVIGKVMEVYEQFYETTTPFTYAMVANQQEYTIDSSLIKVTRVEINYQPATTNSQAVRATPLKMDELPLSLTNNSFKSGSFFNAGYFLHGNIGSQTVGFVPIPTTSDTGNTKSISVWGVALPSDLSSSSDNVNIPYADRFSYLVSLKGAAQLLRKGQQEEASARQYLADYRQGVMDMQTFLKERQSDGVWGVEDVNMEDIDFSDVSSV